MARHQTYRCFAHGGADGWEAICVDLDIAIQGDSFDEVRDLLNHAVATYVRDAEMEAPAAREKLLKRRAPWHVVARLNINLLLSSFRRRAEAMQASFPVYASPQMHYSAISGYN